ncbi:UNVERIFIED_CONTAM: hypothetical protein Slati_2999300 [Sesamum latifolium]|uniref:Uncharacterized protein n=1 Tax=Sesamum latifolium TaxID=2727402 RepID=A0AAW2VFS7_9LAMI
MELAGAVLIRRTGSHAGAHCFCSRDLGLLLLEAAGRKPGTRENAAAGERDLEAGEADHDGAKIAPPVLEEKYLVIMAGQQNPTFLATPASSRASSFGSKRSLSTTSNGESTAPDCEEKKGDRNVETHDDEASLNQVH